MVLGHHLPARGRTAQQMPSDQLPLGIEDLDGAGQGDGDGYNLTDVPGRDAVTIGVDIDKAVKRDPARGVIAGVKAYRGQSVEMRPFTGKAIDDTLLDGALNPHISDLRQP